MADEQVTHTPQEFADAYNKLVQEFGYTVQATPAWIPRDDGTYSLVVRIGIAPVKKENTE